MKLEIVKKSLHNTSRTSNSELFAQMLSFYETLDRGLQRQKKRQTLNTLASNLLFIDKTKKSAVAVESEEERILVVTG